MNFHTLDEEQKAELRATLILRQLRSLGAGGRKKLVDFFGSAHKAITALEEKNPGKGDGLLKPGLIHAYQRGAWYEAAKKCWHLIQNCRSKILLYSDARYPALLREIPDAPLLLFYLGDLSLLSHLGVAVVGARTCTEEGRHVAAHIAGALSLAGVTVVSGLARGVDRAAHLAGLEGPGGSVAVLGSGIDVPYPKDNWDLYDLMEERGLIVSEFMPGAPPLPGHFPVRNRIISGLSRGVLVVEAGLRSGSLITARHAVEQNRDVFVVPGGALSPVSEGCHDLIRRGARVVFSAEDILLELTPALQEEHKVLKNGLKQRSSKYASSPFVEARLAPAALPWDNSPVRAVEARHPTTPSPLSEKHLAELCAGLDPLESEILKLLNQFADCHIDKISVELDEDVACLSGALTMLELRGLVRRAPGMLYSLV